MSLKSVVVIGGGVAGHTIAYQLQGVAKVTLIDPKDYWEVPMALPRLLVDPDALPARMSFKSFLTKARHVQGRVTTLTDRLAHVELNDGSDTAIGFDYAVIATGSVYLDPLIKAEAATEESRAAEIDTMHSRLRTARNVVVVGGGPVGVETAAELRETFPSLSVTLVHGGLNLLDNGPSRFPNWASRSLQDRGVSIMLNDRVVSPAVGRQPTNGAVATSTGRSIAADAVIWATGAKPVTDFVASSWPEVVQENGLIKVDQALRVVGHKAVFAVGDVTNLPEGRLALIGGLHAKSVVANLKRLLAARNPSTFTLKPYKPALPGKGMGKLMIVSLGRKDGLTSLPFGQFRASFLARMIKSRDMLVGTSRKQMHV